MSHANEKMVAVAATLYEARRASRALLGDRWRDHMQAIAGNIALVQKATGMSEIKAAMKMCEKCHSFGGHPSDSVHILAAAVEMVEPST